MTDLTTATTDELLDELMRRHDHAAFIGCIEKNCKPDARGRMNYGMAPRCRGNHLLVLGLIDYLRQEAIGAVYQARGA